MDTSQLFRRFIKTGGKSYSRWLEDKLSESQGEYFTLLGHCNFMVHAQSKEEAKLAFDLIKKFVEEHKVSG